MDAQHRQSRGSGPSFRTHRRRHELILGLIAASLAAPAAFAAPPPPAAPARSGVASGMPPVEQSPADRLTVALAQIGLTACAAPVLRAARFIFEDGEANFTVQPLGPDANRWPTVITVEGAHASMGKTRFTTLTVSPGPGCSGFYEQVIDWPTPCDQLKATVFPTFKDPRVILSKVQVSELNVGLQLYLMPSAGGCTSIKKELFH